MKGPFSALAGHGHEQLLYGADEPSGLRCIIAVHSTTLGPAIGGTRFHPYDTEQDALEDVLRLSEAMTYKAAVAGLDVGGGKAVIWGDPTTDKSEPLLRAYGRMIDSLGGRYVTACDVGTYPDDMVTIKRETPWVTGAAPEEGGSGDSGVTTALGTYVGMRACAGQVWGEERLDGRHVAIQGVGKVGRRLAEHLADEGARLTVADIDEDAAAACAEQLGAEVVGVDDIHAVDCDIYSPNALGGAVSKETLPDLSCRVIAGAANNQLEDDALGAELDAAGILYAPDFVINAGGLIQVTDELRPGGYSEARAHRSARGIGARLTEVLQVARAERIPTIDAALRVADRRIAALRNVSRIRRPTR